MHRIPLLLLIGLAACQAETASLTPLAWAKVPGPGPNGALLGPNGAQSGPAATNAFDERANFTTFAFPDAGTIRLYYGGSDATGNATDGISCSHWRIGMADSPDGVNFTRVPGSEAGGAMIDNGPPGSFDSQLTYRPNVVKDADASGVLYRMWFNGSSEPFNCPPAAPALNRRIGYAESRDGLAWTKFYDGDGPDGSVLPIGPTGAIDAQQVGYAWVIKDGAGYRMYYSANDGSNTWRVALATSTDARHWTKVPGKLSGGAILDIGPDGSFDAACAYQPTVVKERDQLYRMWYRGCVARGVANGPSRGTIGYAESNDGITWIKIAQPTADGSALGVGAPTAFDSGGLTTPSVFLDAGGWSMYYAGFETGGLHYSAGLARAPR